MNKDTINKHMKTYILGLCAIALLFTGCGQTITQKEKAPKKDIWKTYVNQEYGFSLDMTEDWKGFGVTNVKGEIGFPVLRFYVDARATTWQEEEYDVFYIAMHVREWWDQEAGPVDENGEVYYKNATEKNLGTLIGAYLGENNKYAFTWSRGHDCPGKLNEETGEISSDTKQCKLFHDVDELLESFKGINLVQPSSKIDAEHGASESEDSELTYTEEEPEIEIEPNNDEEEEELEHKEDSETDVKKKTGIVSILKSLIPKKSESRKATSSPRDKKEKVTKLSTPLKTKPTTEKSIASILDIPIPKHAHCFYHKNYRLPECSKFFVGDEMSACPKFYKPVFDNNGIFYPTACWAEHLGVQNYTYGLSSRLQQFITDLWFTKKKYSNKHFVVPTPNIEYSYQGSGLQGWRNGTFFRSTLWENNRRYHLLDYNIDTEDGPQQSTSYSEMGTIIPVYGKQVKSLLVFVMFDNAYPEDILKNWTKTYTPVMNKYLKKKQQVPNPIQYDITPVVINTPTGVKRPSPENIYYSDEELKKIFDAATTKLGKSDFDSFIVAPVFLGGFGGYYSQWNDMEFIEAPLHPADPYSATDKHKGFLALEAFQGMFLTISHEILHAVGLQGDHVPMGYGTMYLDFVGADVNKKTGKQSQDDFIDPCEFYHASEDYYAVEMPKNLHIKVGQEPSWLIRTESDSGDCAVAEEAFEHLKDTDNDGVYEIMYKNNLIGPELQRSLGWVDIDGDKITELVDPNPYGNYKKITYQDDDTELLGPSPFTFIQEEKIEHCRFAKVRLKDSTTGLVPLECSDFEGEIVNLYNGINYDWKSLNNNRFGNVLLPRLATY